MMRNLDVSLVREAVAKLVAIVDEVVQVEDGE